ncbi:MAG TPA: hypothetical protein VM118_15445 [Acidobacteriota bacterium]|nr:hypothetical protein [Acidobacteriota bacterium]
MSYSAHNQIPPTPSRSANGRFLVGLLLISCLALLLYGPRLNDFFTSDDFDFLAVWVSHDGAFSAEVWFAGAVAYWPGVARPLIGLTGWPLYHMAGTDPFGWHLVSLMLHLAVVWLTAFLVRRIVRSTGAALVAAAIFAVHFIHAEPVVWISGRSAVLMAALLLGAILAETAPRSRRWGAGRFIGLILGAGAILTHEAAVMLPCLLLLIPDRPIELESPARGPRLLSAATMRDLGRRIRGHWPYWAMVLVFAASHLATTATALSAENIYRIQLGPNVVKNAGFAAVANLFPLDFRALLDVWNQWSRTGTINGVSTYLLAHLGVIIALIAAAIFWLVLFLAGNAAARRLGLWVFVAGFPGFLLPGTGERLLYLGSVGGAGALGAIVAGWHGVFADVFGRRGRMIAPLLVVIVVLLHTVWLRERLRDWEAAAILSRKIVAALDETAGSADPQSTLRIAGLPDNINGAWVFRTSIDDAYRVFGSRRDITIIDYDAESGPSTSLYCWDGRQFIRQVTYRSRE